MKIVESCDETPKKTLADLEPGDVFTYPGSGGNVFMVLANSNGIVSLRGGIVYGPASADRKAEVSLLPNARLVLR